MKNIILTTFAVLALSGTAMAANSASEQNKSNEVVAEQKLFTHGDKSVEDKNDPEHKLTPEEAAKEKAMDKEKLFTHGDKSIEDKNDPKHKLTPEEAAEDPIEGVTPTGDHSPE